ncbi:fungal hydrophobin [Auriculariales sp. MPI-PUGE-AT-0066]|nr:fungal hydrophobin [Auriculariales sp. MPI-PUGE-AT-0066]
MRFTFLPLLAIISAAFTLAAPTDLEIVERRGGGGSSSCSNNTCHGGDSYCCNDSSQLYDPTTGGLLSVPVSLILGLKCRPLTVLGIVVASTCSSSTVCCQNVSSSALVNIQCIAITL